MASEKELFVTKQYVPVGQPISQNDHNIIYNVKCLAEPGHPDGILKMYRGKNVKSLYEQLQKLDYTEWPHIYSVRYFDGSTLVVEEKLNGHTLAELIDRNRAAGTPFTEEEAVRIMEKVCAAIDTLMNAVPPIVHYNLKQSNIFVTAGGYVKLLDFTAGYSKAKNPFSNIFNILGAIFHEMLTNKKPSKKITYKGRYESVIRKCMEKAPEKQYTKIDEIMEDIEIAKEKAPDYETIKVGIPYTLTFPFQGLLLCFEWILFSFFSIKKNMATALLFAIAFVLNSIIFAVRRHAFLKKQGAFPDFFHRFGPAFLLVIIFIAIYFLLDTYIIPMTGL